MQKGERNNTIVDRIIDALVRLGAIEVKEKENIKNAFGQSSSARFDDFLISEGLVERDMLLRALSPCYQVPAYDVVGEFFDHILLTNFPKDFLLRNAVIPLELDGDELVVIAAEPDTPGLEHAIRQFTENDVVFAVGLRTDICDAVKEFYDKSVTEDIPEDLDLHEEWREKQKADQYIRRKRKISHSGENE